MQLYSALKYADEGLVVHSVSENYAGYAYTVNTVTPKGVMLGVPQCHLNTLCVLALWVLMLHPMTL